MKTIGGCTVLLLTLALSLAAAPTSASELAIASPALLQWTLPAAPAVATPVAKTATPIANWTHSGCWTPRSGTPCVDIYRDGSGQLWRCKACGTTGNPSPGKCTKTTSEQLQTGLWCS